MAPIIRIVLIVLFATATSLAQQKSQVLLSAEDSVRSLIEALPEVREKDHIYDSLTNRVQNIVIKINPPDSTLPFYQVQAGYEGGSRFNPHYYFFVDLPNRVIYIEDMDHGDRTTLEEWRARRAPAKQGK